MAKYVVVDSCPCPRKLAPVLERIKISSGSSFNSIYRGDDARALLHKCGKSSQKELYDGFVSGRPGFNPANPPGRSTHECRNDGVAYRGPAGMPLRWWQCGIDCNDSAGVVRAAASLGYTASVTYPGNPREGHHVNLRKKPKLPRKALKRGSRGPRVKFLIWQLRVIRDPQTHKPYLHKGPKVFGPTVQAAVKEFQRDHNQKADGIVGDQTRRNLSASYRFWKAKLKKR